MFARMALVVLTGAFAASACSSLATPSIHDALFLAPVETQVWNNRMPGTRPRCNASLRLLIVNRSSGSVVLRDPEAMIIAAPEGAPLRRFAPLMTIPDRRVRELTLAPGDSIEAAFRSPDFGLEPVDTALYRNVRFMLRMQTSLEYPLQFGSPVVEVFETQ